MAHPTLTVIGLGRMGSALAGCFAAAGSGHEQALIGLGCIRKKVERHLMVKALAPAEALPDPFPTRDVHLVSGDVELSP